MKIFFCKCALWVVELLLGMRKKSGECAVISDQCGKSAVISDQTAMMTAADACDLKWEKPKIDAPVPELWKVVAFGADYVAEKDIFVTLFGGPADGWVEKIAEGKPWANVLLMRVGNQVHAYEMVDVRVVFRHVRHVGFVMGNDLH